MTSLQPSEDEPIHLGGDPYWTQRIEKFNQKEGRQEGLGNIREATKNYATVWSVFAALLMTVSFSLIPVDTGSYADGNDDWWNDFFGHLYVGLLLVSTVFSFMAVFIGTMRYTFFDGIPAAEMPRAVAGLKMPGAQLMVYPAIFTQMAASVVSMYLFMGSGALIMGILIFVLVFVPLFFYVVYTYKTSCDAMGYGLAKPGTTSTRAVHQPVSTE